MKIAVVILNWNGKLLLEQFLPSVVSHSQNADIYVADNASTDNSIEFLKQHYPSVKQIHNKENGGYAKGYNDALKHIEADVFCLLNSDIEVTENWLTPIIKAFNNDKNTAIIQPKLLDFNKKNYFEYAGAAGGFIDKYGYPYCRGRIFDTLEEDKNQYNDNADIFWASGACLFIKSNLFKELNGLDELFFAHMEEIDMCWRAKNLGYNIKYVGASKVYHVGGATLNDTNPKKTFLNFRNSLLTLTKNAKGPIFFLIFVRLILDGIAGAKFISEFKFKHSLAIIKAHFSFYKHLGSVLKQRRTIKKRVNYFHEKSVVFNYFIKKNTKYTSF